MNSRQAAIGLLLSVFAIGALGEDTTPAPPKVDPAPAPRTEATSLADVALGKPLEWNSPKYPKRALQEKRQGSVKLKLTVSKDGEVKHADLMSGDPELAKSAVRSAQKWRYVPYFLDGKPVEVQTTVSINFQIDEAGKLNITAAYKDRAMSPIGEIARPGAGVTAPKLVYSPDPEYSAEALNEHYEGVCVLSLIVGADGAPRDIRVARTLGRGLDEKAIEAVQQWRFLPARKSGVPVAVAINVEVQFRL